MKTIKETTQGKTRLRLVDTGKGVVGLAIENGAQKVKVEGVDPDEVWLRLHDAVGKANPRYVGFAGAANRFLKFFAEGFYSPDYARSERDYKVAAKAMLDRTVPLDQAMERGGFGEPVLAMFYKTNLLSPFEKTWVKDVLRGPGADAFIRSAAAFTTAPSKAALLDMERALKPHGAAKWTVVTYLPFLWRPDVHMFLKPEVTKDFAERVGHRFTSDYQSRLDIDVYNGLLDLAATTEHELADLRPRDRIDVQSFIWVVGFYKEGVDPRS